MPIEPVTKVEPFDSVLRGICELEIIDAETMLVHHKIVWDILNVSNHANPGIEFDAGSIVARSVEQLNFKVTGENIQAEGMKVVKDDPHMKAFFIPYVQPQKPAERRKVLMEYDWEEPDRQYGYNFAGKYEDFTFRLIVPEYLQIKPAIHSIRESGKAIESTLLQEEQYISSVVGGNLILEWHSMDVPPLSVYRFDW